MNEPPFPITHPADRPRSPWLAWGLLLLAFASGCRSTTTTGGLRPFPDPLKDGDRLFDSGDYPGAARSYESYLASHPGGQEADRALLHLAVIYFLPDQPAQDRNAAKAVCRRLLDTFPQSPYRAQAEILLDLQAEVERLDHQLQELKRIDLRRARPTPPDG